MQPRLRQMEKGDSLPPSRNRLSQNLARYHAVAVLTQAGGFKPCSVMIAIPEPDFARARQFDGTAVTTFEAGIAGQRGIAAVAREILHAMGRQIIVADLWRQRTNLTSGMVRRLIRAGYRFIILSRIIDCRAKNAQQRHARDEFCHVFIRTGRRGRKTGDRNRGCDDKCDKLAMSGLYGGPGHAGTFLCKRMRNQCAFDETKLDPAPSDRQYRPTVIKYHLLKPLRLLNITPGQRRMGA